MKPLISVKLVSIYDRAPYRKAVVRFRRASNRLYVRMVLLLCAGGATFFLFSDYRRDLAWAGFAACYLTSFALYPRWLRIHARIIRLIDHANAIGLRQIEQRSRITLEVAAGLVRTRAFLPLRGRSKPLSN